MNKELTYIVDIYCKYTILLKWRSLRLSYKESQPNKNKNNKASNYLSGDMGSFPDLKIQIHFMHHGVYVVACIVYHLFDGRYW